MNFKDLDAKLQGRNHESRKYERNTYLQRRKDNIAMLYHETDVATFFPNGDIKLDSGGWHTKTTKERMTSAIGYDRFNLYSKNGVWYIGNRKSLTSVIFKDGMVLKANGKIIGGIKETPKKLKSDTKFKERVKKYAQKCADAVPLDQPSGGDCWYCYMQTDKSETLGDAFKDTSHLDEHMREGYVVPSLVYNALKQYYNAPAAMWETFKGSGWGEENQTTTQNIMMKMGGFSRDFGKNAVRKSVYRYIMNRKGYGV